MCPDCLKITTAFFPDGVTHKAQYGSGIQAVAVYLRNYQLIPLERTVELFRDLFKISLSEGTIVNMTTRCADQLLGFLDKHREEILRFMKEPDVPFDNNLAECDLKMVKVRQKISGTFRNMDRLKDYCRIRSYISTMKKQNKDVFFALVELYTPKFKENPAIL